MKVFISYSHNDADTPLAHYLATRLRAIGIDVWQDESSEPSGDELQASIEKAILDSDHAIFLVSKLWLASRWCKVEVDRFDRRDHATVRRIPIYRLTPERLRLPMQLIDLKGITWLEDEAHDDARFWEVYCAVVAKDPGPVDTWAAESAKLGKADLLPPVIRPTGPSLESLRCDRGVQWGRLLDLGPERSHDVVIVPGAAGEAHDHFSQRIREMLTTTPPRNVVTVHWRTRPSSRDEFLAALAADFGVSAPALGRDMAERMSDANLVLIHPCLRTRYLDAALISYYTEWLPGLVSEVKPSMSLKCVQPVEWPAGDGALSGVLSWMRLKPPATDEGKPDAERLIGRIQSGTAPTLRAVTLQDLAPITRADLDEFCQIEKLTTTQKTWLLSRIDARRPRNSQETLEAIDAYLVDARSVS